MKLLVLAYCTLAILLLSTILVAAVDEELLWTKLQQHQIQEPTLSSSVASLFNEAMPAQSKIDLDANGFSLDNAKIFSRLSAAAYCSPPSIKESKQKLDNWKCTACVDSGITLTNVVPFHIALADLFGYIGYNAQVNTVVVAFTGSQSIVNWLYNLDAQFVPFDGVDGGEVHKGFYNTWKYARPTIIALIDNILNVHPTATISITGHSLGGAIAFLAGVDIATTQNGFKLYNHNGIQLVQGGNAFDDVIPADVLAQASTGCPGKVGVNKYKMGGSIYTFGQPRVFNNLAANFIMDKLGKLFIIRTTHKQDIVCHLPPLALWKTASHTTTEAFYKDLKDSTTVNDFTICALPEDPSCSNQYSLPVSMDDHLNYMNYHLGTQPTNAC